MFNILEDILNKSGLGNLFELKMKDDKTNEANPYVAYRVKPNLYRIRSFELCGDTNDYFFRVYHADNINDNLKNILFSMTEVESSTKYHVTFKNNKIVNYIDLANNIKNTLIDKEIKKVCEETGKIARISKFEGLQLPDVDISEENVLGQTFNWREIIAIYEDNSEDNKLKAALSKNGIYIQRSKDGKSRYIGSAYGSGGIIGRWMAHLNSNGDAQHLNLFVLENGYNEIVFSVIEFYEGKDIIQREAKWKQILGTINFGPYNGIQLNRN